MYESGKDRPAQQSTCPHTDTHADIHGVVSCVQCGEEITCKILHEKEWRYYGSSDSKRMSDPNRVQIRKVDDRTIHKDVESMGFSETIVNRANTLYKQVTKADNGYRIYRGNSRKAIIFACIFHAYKLSGKHQTPEHLIKLFGLNRKNGLKGLKIVNVNAPKDSKIHTTHITPVHIITDIMDQFKASPQQKSEVTALYEKIRNRSSKLNRARPQSVAAALTYYWIRKTGLDISLREFANTVKLSELTINKNAKEIQAILCTSHVIA